MPGSAAVTGWERYAPGWIGFALLLFAALPALAADAITVHGTWTQGAPLHGEVAPGSRVRFEGRDLRVDAQGRFAIGLGHEAPLAAEIEVISADGAVRRHEFAVAQREYETQRINGLPGNMVTPPQAVLDRIADDQARVTAAREFDTARDDALGPWRWPLAARVTGVFGARRILNGEPRQPHFGIDLAAGQGTPIHAPAGGVVRMADRDLYYTGGTIILDHGHGYSTTYLHLSRLDVAVGDEVRQGQVIGLVGKTGRATGPHLCWRANWFEVRLDPSLLVEAQPARKGERKQ